MRTEALWNELEEEVRAGATGAWLSRFALPRSGTPLMVAIEPATHLRALLLPAVPTARPPSRDWPQCKGLDVFAAVIDGVDHLGVRLTDPGYADVLSTLADDLAPRVTSAPNQAAAAAIFIDRLKRWQKFMAARAVDMSLSRQRGLFGELHTMRKWVLPAYGPAEAVRCWRALHAAHQDFQFPGGAIEVKTTTGKQPLSVRITSERQLDDTGIRALFLHVVALDEREIVANNDGSGETLPDLIGSLQAAIDVDPVARAEFDDRILECGYLDADSERYSGRRYAERTEYSFQIEPGFPRLTDGDLKVGIGDISYVLSLSACMSFAVQSMQMMSTLRGEYIGG